MLFLLDPTLSGYHRKKYVCKLMYLYILGYEIDFGHSEAVDLMDSAKFSEKQIVSYKPFKNRHYD